MIAGSAVETDRIVVAQLVGVEVDLTAARTTLEGWLDDHPEVDELIEIELVPTLEAAERFLVSVRAEQTHGRAVLAVAVPVDAVADAEYLFAQERGVPWALVLTVEPPTSVVEVVAATTHTCELLLALASADQLRTLPPTPPTPPFAETQESPMTVHPAMAKTETAEPHLLAGVTPESPTDETSVAGHLLYIAWLGEQRDGRQAAAQRRWAARTLDHVADRSSRHVVRLIALGDGISDQSRLGPAEEFRTPSWLARRRHGWPKVRGNVGLVQVFRDLGAQLARDVDQLTYEGVAIGDRTCVVVVGQSLAGGGSLEPAFESLTSSMRFIWVTPSRQRTGVPAALITEGSVHLVEHPEIDQEIARRLGLEPDGLRHRLGQAD